MEQDKVFLNEKPYVVKPLCLRDLKKVQPIIESMGDKTITQMLDDVADVVLIALSNGNEITREEVESGLTIKNALDIQRKILVASGLVVSGELTPVVQE